MSEVAPYFLKKNRSPNEPKVPSLIRKSFAFVPSAGMRLSPEILVLELMREIFYSEHFGSSSNKDLDAEYREQGRYVFTEPERAVLHCLRGRRKKSKQSKAQLFYAPAYPSLAENAWLGEKRERIINNFLFSGAISQHLWGSGKDKLRSKEKQNALAQLAVRALLGHNSPESAGDHGDKEILAAAIFETSKHFDKQDAIDRIESKTELNNPIIPIANDEIGDRITKDFEAICKLEAYLPRMQWTSLLMTFLRFALPIWVLSQMQITSLIHSWIVDAIDKGIVPNKSEILDALKSRNRALLHPTLTATRELFDHTENYIKHRVELSIIVYALNECDYSFFLNKHITCGNSTSNELSIEDLLIFSKKQSETLKNLPFFREIGHNEKIKTILTREGEKFAAWRNPLNNGQGKNIDEFFRVLYKAESGDEEGGFLLTPQGRASTRGFRVFPGQLLLKTITYLAAQKKRCGDEQKGGGKLVLQDVENHFEAYGIEFDSAADARPLLVQELQSLGLLAGSPDAGSSVEVTCPYALK